MENALLVLGALSLLGLGCALMASIARNNQLLQWNINEGNQKRAAHAISREQKARIKELTREMALLRKEHADRLVRIDNDHEAALLRQRQAHALATIAQATEKELAVTRALDEVDEAYRERLRAMERSLEAMLEPSRGECTKIRFHQEAEAMTFARELEVQDGLPEGAMGTYSCRVCPRSPWTIRNYFHVTSGGQSKEIRSSKPRPNRLGNRIDPSMIEALKRRANGAS